MSTNKVALGIGAFIAAIAAQFAFAGEPSCCAKRGTDKAAKCCIEQSKCCENEKAKCCDKEQPKKEQPKCCSAQGKGTVPVQPNGTTDGSL